MRTLPTGSVDPNFGRRVRNRRQLNSLQNTWPYGYSMPIAVRYTQDAAYHLLEGFPFIQEPPSGDLQERVLIRHHDYDQCFQSVQLLQWNSQVKFNVTVYRNLPTTRDSIMTS